MKRFIPKAWKQSSCGKALKRACWTKLKSRNARNDAGLNCKAPQAIFTGLASPRAYLTTLSARASTFGGTVTPICLADFKLITNSNFVGCSTGMSAGFVPFKILSTKSAARRYRSV